MKKTIIAVALLGVGAAAAIGFALKGSTDKTVFRTVAVERGDITSLVSSTGTLSAVRTIQVGTQVSGQIAHLYVDFNDHVRKGELVAQLDTTLLVQAVHQAGADLSTARANLVQKRYLLTQATAMHAANLIAETDFRAAEYDTTAASAAVVSAQAAYERAHLNLQYASIRSPIDGVVLERDVDVGQTVAASLSAPQLFLIAEDLSRMQILVAVDESDIGQIHPDQTATFTVQAYPNRTFTGTVGEVRMQSKTTENVVNYTVVLIVANQDHVLLPGMTATVNFQVAKATDVFKVANAVLRFRPSDSLLAAMGVPASDSSRQSVPGDSATRPAGAARTSGGAGQRGGAARTNAAAGVSVPHDVRMWYVDASGRPAVMRVHTGLSDGTMTEITAPALRVGMLAISGTTTAAAALATKSTNPFQAQRPAGGGGPRGM